MKYGHIYGDAAFFKVDFKPPKLNTESPLKSLILVKAFEIALICENMTAVPMIIT